MARPRTPTEVLKLKGAFKKDPGRGKARENEPKPTGVLGDAPEFLSDEQKKVWKELATIAPARVLTNADRLLVEVTCRLVAKMRAEGLATGEQAQLIQCLGRMGLTPADRSKVAAVKGAENEDAFAQIARDVNSSIQ